MCDPFAFCFRAYHCFACTWMSSADLHVIVFTFGAGFEFRLPPLFFNGSAFDYVLSKCVQLLSE